ncbi:MAG: YqgE/AlgH family protein [Deltaproteobacteria bacterium]|nr:YqgE/AlgH family protein [Deltaproteobacteria bacterium]MBW2150906.1 YqgE/AlgH family protein [Deltaproteobacteria bacterium]
MNDKKHSFILCTMLAVVLCIPPAAPAISGQRTDPTSMPLPPDISISRLDKGKFLVASQNLVDPNFSQTVVLLLEYVLSGAMGVVINRPSDVKLSKILPEIKGLKQRTETVYIGGPVAGNQMILLVRSSSQQPEASFKVFDDVFVCSSLKVIEQIIERGNVKERFRVYAGYAGWSPGQLDQEVNRGDWHIFQADPETIFDKDASDIWPEFIRRSTTKYVRITD